MNTESQNLMVLKHLDRYGQINPKQADRLYGIMRLGARIYDLRDIMGKDRIKTLKVAKKNRFGKVTRFANYVLQ